jgi:H+/Na+-translocating ferredoxin:NAD+ oxidoreductase subunit D
MNNPKKFIVSHAPFWHNGSGVPERNFNVILAAVPAAFMGLAYFGVPALGVLCLAVASAIGWEALFNLLARRPISVDDGHAAMIGMLFGMLLPATAPYWLVLTGTFFAIFIGKQIYGGIGSNPFNPAVLAVAIITISWKAYFDFDAQLLNYHFDFTAFYPPAALKAFGPAAIDKLSLVDLLLGRQVGAIGATCGLALILGGLYLIARGFVRWEIPLAFIGGVVLTAAIFHIAKPAVYAGPLFHLLIGYTLIGAFFLATDDSSSPVNTVPMLIFGATGGMMAVLIRNIGAYPDGTLYAILVINMINPLLDKIRPKALGKAV